MSLVICRRGNTVPYGLVSQKNFTNNLEMLSLQEAILNIWKSAFMKNILDIT